MPVKSTKNVAIFLMWNHKAAYCLWGDLDYLYLTAHESKLCESCGTGFTWTRMCLAVLVNLKWEYVNSVLGYITGAYWWELFVDSGADGRNGKEYIGEEEGQRPKWHQVNLSTVTLAELDRSVICLPLFICLISVAGFHPL